MNTISKLSSKDLSHRIHEIRLDHYGGGRSGTIAVAGELGLPARTWENYEEGVTIPAPVLLHFIALTGANPGWLMDGSGPRYFRASRVPHPCA